MTMTTEPPVQPNPVDYAARPVARPRQFNWRMLVVIGVFGLLVGYPVYTYVKAQVNGGVEHVASGYVVDLKALGNFPFDPATGTIKNVPEKFRDLDGKPVTLEGYCYSPNGAVGNTTQFQFVYNVTKCCFSGPPQVQERVIGIVPGAGMSVPDQNTMIRLNGILHVNVERSGGTVNSVYTLDVKGGGPVS